MKIGIAYAGKTGTSEKCANLLRKLLPDAVLCDLTKGTPDFSAYDSMVVGGSIRAGMLHKSAKKFLKENEAALSEKKIAFFLCCGFAENAPRAFDENFPASLREKAVTCECFGGEMEMDRLKGFDKFVAKIVTKLTERKNIPAPKIDEAAISRLAQAVLK